jgi:hypothetical protein
MIMTVAELLKLPVDYSQTEKKAAFGLTIKTIKKKCQIDNNWLQQVVFTDKTGDILADIVLAKNEYGWDNLSRNQLIRIITWSIQASETGKKLLVSEYELPTQTEPEDYVYANKTPDWEKIAEGKVRHGVVCAYLQGGREPEISDVLYWTKFIMTGEPDVRPRD